MGIGHAGQDNLDLFWHEIRDLAPSQTDHQLRESNTKQQLRQQFVPVPNRAARRTLGWNSRTLADFILLPNHEGGKWSRYIRRNVVELFLVCDVMSTSKARLERYFFNTRQVAPRCLESDCKNQLRPNWWGNSGATTA